MPYKTCGCHFHTQIYLKVRSFQFRVCSCNLYPWENCFPCVQTQLYLMYLWLSNPPNMHSSQTFFPSIWVLCGYVIAWAWRQLKINFMHIFRVFQKLPESWSDEGNLGEKMPSVSAYQHSVILPCMWWEKKTKFINFILLNPQFSKCYLT